eukprot:CAMPEP_0178919890 /NCGR_PEP_ID=MMETSP0786-20121207/14693_1 /TAXON_ID=186022 /ORGANISM="Thalassionema frauenfeldii, Strain CCMP 1798" /LENGTH=549 /DNA_ID=CAMNT_0020593881 /DNA_START=21 /DNA_END=1670 /DNA_ORIENTATION=+
MKLYLQSLFVALTVSVVYGRITANGGDEFTNSARSLSVKSKTEDSRYLHYGEAIYLQNNALDHRWLTLGKKIEGTTCFTDIKKSKCVKSSRSCGGLFGSAYKQIKKRDCGVVWEKKFECQRKWCELDIVATTDIYNTDNIIDDHFEWIVTQPNSEANEGNNGESKTCVKYGDEFSLKSKWEDRLLTGRRTKEFEAEPGPDMMWVARSTPGSGDLDQNKADNADPAFGECISDKSLVFLQNLSKSYQWLSGARSGGNTKVYLQNIHEINEGAQNYGWIMRKYKGSGSRNDRLQCAAVTAVGRWVKLNSISSDSLDGPPTQTVKYSKGTQRSTSHEETNTNEWETSVTAAITTGFNYMAASGSASLEVSSSYASTLSSTISNTVAEDSSKEYEATFPGEGQIWQFQYAIEDICNSGASLLSSDLAHTSDGEPPCCLPNQEINSLHGPCKPGTPCSCSRDICEVRSSGQTSSSLASNSIESSTDETGGGMIALFVAIPIVLAVLASLTFFLCRKYKKKVPSGGTVKPTGVLFEKDPLGFLDKRKSTAMQNEP